MASTFNILQEGKKETVNFDFILITNEWIVDSIDLQTTEDIDNLNVEIENARLNLSCKNAWIESNSITLSLKMRQPTIEYIHPQFELLVYDHIITEPFDSNEMNQECSYFISPSTYRYDSLCLKEKYGDSPAELDFHCTFAPKNYPNTSCTINVSAFYTLIV